MPRQPKIRNYDTSLLTQPFPVFLARDWKLVIKKGDDLSQIAKALAKILKPQGLTNADALDLAAYFFAIGERTQTRQLDRPWKTAELRTNNRAYLTSSSKR